MYEIAISEREVNPRYEEKNFSRQPQREKTFTISDSHLTRINKDIPQKKVKLDKVYFRCFSEASTKQLDHYLIPMLVDEKPQTVGIQIVSNDIIKFNYHDVDIKGLVYRTMQIGLKPRYGGVQSIAICSVPVRNNNLTKCYK